MRTAMKVECMTSRNAPQGQACLSAPATKARQRSAAQSATCSACRTRSPSPTPPVSAHAEHCFPPLTQAVSPVTLYSSSSNWLSCAHSAMISCLMKKGVCTGM